MLSAPTYASLWTTSKTGIVSKYRGRENMSHFRSSYMIRLNQKIREKGKIAQFHKPVDYPSSSPRKSL